MANKRANESLEDHIGKIIYWLLVVIHMTDMISGKCQMLPNSGWIAWIFYYFGYHKICYKLCNIHKFYSTGYWVKLHYNFVSQLWSVHVLLYSVIFLQFIICKRKSLYIFTFFLGHTVVYQCILYRTVIWIDRHWLGLSFPDAPYKISVYCKLIVV